MLHIQFHLKSKFRRLNNIKTVIAISSGALLGPIFYLATPEWSILIAGIAGGSMAFFIKDKKNGSI